MCLQVIVLSLIVMGVVADHPRTYLPPPVYKTSAYQPPIYYPSAVYEAQEHTVVPPKYTYNYGVADGYSGANFGHSEARDGYKTQGSYAVDLPDGRKQLVKYVDNGDGLIAEVSYEGKVAGPPYSHSPQRYA